MMLPRVLKYSGASFWDLRKDDVVDFDEMRGAYLRATQDDKKELERLREQVRELQSEIQRLEKLANYG